MRATAKKYITSERFIHDGLLRDCAGLIEKLYEIWGREKIIRPSLLLFPADYLKDDVGETINGVVSMALDLEASHRDAIKQAVMRVGAYAFFYARTEEHKVKALLESPHGTREWTMGVAKSGPDRVLSSSSYRDNVPGLGILWSSKQGRS